MAAIGNFLNPCITKLELLCNSQQIGTATGFFYKMGEQWYVISNWHVLSGRNPNNGQPTHLSGAIPEECRFFYATVLDTRIGWLSATYPLGDASGGGAKWFEHPIEGQEIDIGALPIKSLHRGIAKDLQDRSGNDPDMFIDLGAELFLPGFPLGLTAGGIMSIWKRASLASSLEFEPGLHRYFYVDTATREGMSGAPCLATSNWQHYSMNRKTNKVSIVKRPMSWRLLGVYSGRRNPSDSFEAQIGLVWRESLMQEILLGNKEASVKLK